MKTDRELLELAAKAAALPAFWDDAANRMRVVIREGRAFSYWQPLHDDGDALRLAVKLGLTVCNEHESAGAVCCTRSDGEDFTIVDSGKPGDPPGITGEDYAATRRAIVLAAAAIGEAMP